MQLKSRTTITLILSKTQHNQRAFPAGILCSKRECPHAYQFKTINNNRLANKSALCFWWWTTIATARSNAASNSVVYYSRRGSFTPKFSTSIRGKTAASSINKKPTFSKCHPANPRLIASSDGCRFLREILSPSVQTIRCSKWQIRIGGVFPHFLGGNRADLERTFITGCAALEDRCAKCYLLRVKKKRNWVKNFPEMLNVKLV